MLHLLAQLAAETASKDATPKSGVSGWLLFGIIFGVFVVPYLLADLIGVEE